MDETVCEFIADTAVAKVLLDAAEFGKLGQSDGPTKGHEKIGRVTDGRIGRNS